jgi:S1-C subfamily serine protease
VRAVDVVLLVWVALSAASGFLRGFAAQVLTLVGVVSGLIVGAWLAPRVIPGGDESEWVPLASLVGAAVGAAALGLASGRLSTATRVFLATRPALRIVDRTGGVVAGALLALALAWLGAVLLLHHSELGLRRTVQRSVLMSALVRAVPPEPVLRAPERFDPLPILPGLAPRALPPPDPTVIRTAGARAAAASVVKVEGTSCGLGVQGSGWVVRDDLVATNAHVVSGQDDTTVLTPGGQSRDATVVYLDGGNDVALLHVAGLAPAPLRIDRSDAFPRAVALLGYPRDGPLTATAWTAGAPRSVLAPDAYERRVAPRVVVPLRGRVQPGESGGPVVDRRGRVLAMIFGGHA